MLYAEVAGGFVIQLSSANADSDLSYLNVKSKRVFRRENHL